MHPPCVVEAVERAELVVVPRGRRPAGPAWSTLVAGLPPAERQRLGPVYRDDSQLDSAIGWSLLMGLAAQHGVSVWRDAAGRPAADPPVDVSLSHGGGWVAAAAYRFGRVGVDVEAAREVSPALARRCLSLAELRWLEDASDQHSRQTRFTRLWTAKEAYLKATGTGLAVDPRSFSIDASRDEPKLVGVEEGRWRFRSITPEDGVCVTLCVQVAS